ncbi:hypothetical protein DL546_004942 [Coniochaeta pulveracea]|uniref:Thioredoxin n=1 Tax=Coniochaeta pulveracea TaxID=177199 RepID=A0A420Y120_9PEZI|nr:hypothetical protein DL546_004942 [Coniochaeta pulveracea]
MAVKSISSASELDGLLKKQKAVVVDFYADWCGPCKQIAPHYKTLAEKLSAQSKNITFAKVDTEVHKDIALKYNITTLPTFLLFRDGKVHETVVGADKMQILNSIMGLFTAVESENGGASGSGGSGWLGAELPRGYGDVTDQIEIKSTELLNFDEEAGSVRVLFDSAKPSALSDAKGADNKAKDWVESDTDEQLMLFLPFQSTLKLHTLQITSLPPQDDDDDETPMRPRKIKLFSNRPHNLGFEEAEDMTATQIIELPEKDWNKDGTANIPLRYVKFQNINSLVLFVVEGDGDGEKVRLDRIRLVGEAGQSRDMGKLEKVGDLPGE